MENKEYTVRDKDFMRFIAEAFPHGRKYADMAMDLVMDLDRVSSPYYEGNLISDYGLYPFLNARSLCYEKDGVTYDHVILRSSLDVEELQEWVDGLSIPKKAKKDISADMGTLKEYADRSLDPNYEYAMRYLIEYLVCLKCRDEERNRRLTKVLTLPVHSSMIVTFNDLFTRDYLTGKIRKYNKKAVGKRLVMREYPPIPGDNVAVVSCEDRRGNGDRID